MKAMRYKTIKGRVYNCKNKNEDKRRIKKSKERSLRSERRSEGGRILKRKRKQKGVVSREERI